jgi:hypothetical protein
LATEYGLPGAVLLPIENIKNLVKSKHFDFTNYPNKNKIQTFENKAA